MAAQITSINTSDQDFDPVKEAKQFDDSKIGVKGLLDSGLTSIPPIFIHPNNTLSDLQPLDQPHSHVIPIIDLSAFDSDRRSVIVDQISRACKELGFFQIVNHGVPVEIMDGLIGAVKAFHELPTETKKQWYRRETATGVSFFSNVDLFNSKAASWRKEVVEWNKQATRGAEILMELLCEGLGLKASTLKDMTCLESTVMVDHYYSYCPQPSLTVGITSHTDPGVLTLLLQDQVGGLQVKHGDNWVNVNPVPSALVISIADILQIMSNDEYLSVDHSVLANPLHVPRVSIGIFFNAGKRDGMFGPIPNLISPEKAAHYRQFMFMDYMKSFFFKALGSRILTDYYRL